MVDPSRTVTVAGLPALSTGPLASMLAVAPVSEMRAVTPTRITAIAATSDTATIFRWVVRSAVTSEWFMGPSPRSEYWSRRPGGWFNRATRIPEEGFVDCGRFALDSVLLCRNAGFRDR